MLDPVQHHARVIGALWGYAKADATMVGILVAVVTGFALVYVGARVLYARTGRGRASPGADGRASGRPGGRGRGGGRD